MSSRLTAMTTWLAVPARAWFSTPRRVPSPLTATSPAALASATASSEVSMTTIDSGGVPDSVSVLTTARPLDPYPTTTT